MSELAIAVVVVCRDSEEAIDACLARLRAAEGVAEIRVVDCNSRDTTLAIVQRHALADARLRFIANPDDPGHGAACNQGVAACRAPWLALLDPGCLIEPDALMRLRELAARDDALVGASQIDEAGMVAPDARLAPSRAGEQGDWRWLGFAPIAESDQDLQDVAAVAGAAVLLSRERFEALGGFDPAYASGIALLDLCRRAHAAGTPIACASAVRITHVRGLLARAHPLSLAWRSRIDASRYLWRHHPHAAAARAWLRIWASLPWELLRVLVRGGGWVS